jgi:cytoskeleton protein RodZ
MTDAPGSANRNEEGASGLQRLRAERERRGLGRQQVADDLHVDVRIIEALEAGRFDSLGAPVYARGHLRKYAELLGLDAEQTLAAIEPELAQPPALVRIAPARRSRPEVPVKVIGALVIGALIAGTAWWALSGRDQGGRDSSPAPVVPDQPAVDIVSEPVTPAAAAPVAESEATAEPPGTSIGPVAQTAAAIERAPPATAVRLRLSFSADSWVELYDASGRRFYFDLGPANSVRSFTAAAPVRVYLGNADGVQIELNGQAIAVPEHVRRGDVARFTIDARGQVRRAEG